MARSIWGQPELPRQSRSQSSACSMSMRKCWLVVEKTHQPPVWNGGVLVFSTNDSTASGTETTGTEMQPMGTFSTTKLKYFRCCSVYKLSSPAPLVVPAAGWVFCHFKVWQRSCVMQREFLNKNCWHTIQYLLTLCDTYVGEKGPWDPEGKKQSSALILFPTFWSISETAFWNFSWQGKSH